MCEPMEYGCRHGCGAMFTNGRLAIDHEQSCQESPAEQERRELVRMAPAYVEHPCDEFKE